MLNRLLRLERQARQGAESAEFLCESAALRRAAGDLAGAMAAIERAEALAAKDRRGLVAVGRLLEDLNQPTRAEAVYRQATQLDDEAVAAHCALGRLALSRGDHASAVIDLSTAVWRSPTDPDCHLMLARALLGDGRPQEARTHVVRAIALSPARVEALRLRCLIAEHCGPEEKVSALRGAVEALPDDVELARRLVAALDAVGRPEEATRALQTSAQRRTELLPELGRRLALEHAPEARRVLEAACRQPGCPADLFYLLGRAQQLSNEHAAADQSFRQAAALGLRTPDLCCSQAWSQQQLGDYGGAVNTLVQGLMTWRDDPEISGLLRRVQTTLPPARMPVEGSGEHSRVMVGGLDCIPVVDFLEFLRINRRTGTLRLTHPRGVAELYLIEGSLASVSSSNVPRLGEHLVARNMVTSAQMARLVGDHDGVFLGRRLVELGVVSLNDLLDALYEQATSALTEIIGWNEGQFVFRPDESLREKIPPEFELNTARVLLDALRLMDEAAAS